MADKTDNPGAAKASPKRKSSARKRPAAKTAAAPAGSGSTARKRTAARKSPTAAKGSTGTRRGAARRRSPAPQPDLAGRARQAGRSAFLAGLGCYGKAFDQVQEQVSSAQDQLAQRRKRAEKRYAALVKRGEKVEKEARSAIDDIELPRQLESLTDRKQLEARLEKARSRFNALRESVRFNSAAH